MTLRPRKSVFKLLALAGLALVAVGGLALYAMPARQPQAVRPAVQLTPRPAASVSPSSSPAPAVAGAATAAPQAPASPTPHNSTHVQNSTPAAAQPAQVTLVLAIAGKASSFGLPLVAGHADACTILVEAKAEGKIASVTLTYYPSFQSNYVSEINGYKDNWTFKYNGSLPPVGCSKVPLKVGDTVTWQFSN